MLPDRAFELLVTWRGNVAAVHRELVAEGIVVPGVRTLRRAIAREVSLAQRDYITDGDDGVRERTVYLRHEARFRGECYEGDHKQLSIEVLAPRATRAQRAVGDAVRRSVLAADRGLGAVAAADRGRGARGGADGRR